MKTARKKDAGLEKKFQKVAKTPASFDFYIAVHDFVAHIEQNSTLVKGLSDRIKVNQELDIATKYGSLRYIYQGLEDIDKNSKADLGHARYAAIRELTQIRNADFSESNSLWKKRELWRRFIGIIYERLGGEVPEEFISAKAEPKKDAASRAAAQAAAVGRVTKSFEF